MRLTIKITDERTEPPKHGIGGPVQVEYTRVEIDSDADPHVTAGQLRAVADSLDQRPNPGAPY